MRGARASAIEARVSVSGRAGVDVTHSPIMSSTLASTRNARTAGFSLVEIALIILILLTLAGAMIVFVLPQQNGADINETKLKLARVQAALDAYKIDFGGYPPQEHGGLNALQKRPEFNDEVLVAKWKKPYLPPEVTLDDAWGRPLRLDDGGPYSLGPDGEPTTEDDVRLGEIEGSNDGASPNGESSAANE